jgi:hypothetical protein
VYYFEWGGLRAYVLGLERERERERERGTERDGRVYLHWRWLKWHTVDVSPKVLCHATY